MTFLKSLFFVVLFLVPSFAFAATLHLEPQASVLGTQNTFSIAVLLDSDKPVNTISVSIIFPKALEPKDVEIGESVINLWVDKPLWNETTRTLTFSGIIPGGIVTTNAPLLTVECDVVDPNISAAVSFDEADSHAYLSDGRGTEDTLTFENLILPVALGKDNLSPDIPDTTIPESFTPQIGRDSTVFNGLWFLDFSTEDKSSGVVSYQVREKKSGVLGLLTPSPWENAESPYLLTDQSLSSEIDVQAINKDGAVRLEVIPPRFPLPWYESLTLWIILILISLLYVVIRVQKKAKVF